MTEDKKTPIMSKQEVRELRKALAKFSDYLESRSLRSDLIGRAATLHNLLMLEQVLDIFPEEDLKPKNKK